MFIDLLFSRINKLKNHNYLYLTPNVYTVGNCSAEILFGIIKAKSKGKLLFIIYPFDIPFIFKWRLTNNELFLLESKYIAQQSMCTRLMVRLLATIVYIPIRIYGLTIRDCFGKKIDESISIPRIGENEIFSPIFEEKNYDYFHMKQYILNYCTPDKMKDLITKVHVLSENESINNLKKTLGMLETDWYVCLHVREAGFRDDAGRREYRNSNICNYIKAIKEITSRGGYVVRMGDNTMLRLPNMERVIDYPFTDYNNDVNDLLLIKYCFFYLGTQSGILDVANLFFKNVLLTNMVTWGASGLRGAYARGILKHWFCKEKNKYLSLEELFSIGEGFIEYEHVIWDNNEDAMEWKKNFKTLPSIDGKYFLTENNEDEINDAVIEYFDLLHSKSLSTTYLQNSYINYRNKCIENFLHGDGIYMFDSDRRNKIENYQYCFIVELSDGLISNSFLSKNWKNNSKNRV